MVKKKKNRFKKVFMEFLEKVNGTYPVSYNLFKKKNDRIYSNLKLSLKEKWLRVPPHSDNSMQIGIFVLTILVLMFFELKKANILITIFLCVALLISQEALSSSRKERYTNEKFLELSKK